MNIAADVHAENPKQTSTFLFLEGYQSTVAFPFPATKGLPFVLQHFCMCGDRWGTKRAAELQEAA